jgi:2-oxoacid:acceptor oxidoreductase gamma subunit (pyruvate/2-ketoisovalerate family)
MTEVKFYGRGGQGAVIASVILANAAFKEGKFVQAFPFYGIERRGAPVWAYTRIDTKPILARGQIHTPGIVVILDSYIIETLNITNGLKENGIIIINTEKNPKDFSFGNSFNIFTCDATSIAVKYGLGAKTLPIVNTTMLGAFSKATGLVKLESIIDVIPQKVSVKTEENIRAVREAYESVIRGKG